MAEVNSYQMAIDLLCCHLGLTVEEAKQQLGITTQPTMQTPVSDIQQSLLGLSQDK
ncbi:hypothetical protein P0F15_000107 [Vibrio metschnikovii]|jgi:hypothetical protein|uniref:Heat-shock protein HtpX n=6 Tax=Unclassified Bacteria TaxID=49928 RepID=A0AAU6SUR6_UNCXX|nr:MULTISPECIES: hypothetical protein [Vibrio]EEX36956.1 hypothetical protein VIB_001065 [Vibrio metschnikovii CIP 69.14]EKO3556262.1 hypothetical protein [Vibrio metschnikovii]EKO3563841.1 hypothetical protein [Vibrio metschnikovii]EKO3567754.1 hypothetical protein [Vibrio metschnikovii]EKO3572552.1 hypothetical protein [Vibrio metschnikovii]